MRISCSLDDVKQLKPEALRKILASDKTGEFVLVDVRQPEEYGAGHIPGARLVPLGELEARQRELERGKKIVTYCRSGHRSMGAAIMLCGLGFKEVYTMDGGILDWKSGIITGMPEERPRLVTGKEEAGDVLMVALKLEKGSQDFYVQAAERVESQVTRKTLQKLAHMEGKHMEEIYDRYGEVLGKEKLPTFDVLRQKINSEWMESGIKISRALLAVEEREFRDDMEVLEVALEKEYLSYDFYKQTAGLMADAHARALLHKLAWEERSHIDSLLNEIRELVKESQDDS